VDGAAEEGQQTKGDKMTLGDFMDVLGKLHKLTPAQRRAVAEVLVEPEEVQRPTEAAAKPARLANHFRPFSTDEREKILEWAWLYLESSSAAAKRKIYRVAAETLGRSPESVKKAIRNARRELEGREPRRVK
jgi:hypothetical protein